MKRVFITATGTEVGKTVVTVLLARQLRAKRLRVRIMKPLVTGFDPAAPQGSDPARLIEALGEPYGPKVLDRVSPFRFVAPMSPDMAARREGRALDPDALRACVEAAAEGPEDALLVEGIGGAMVPLMPGLTVREWMAALKMPALVVAASALGTLSHTLCTLEALRIAGIEVRGVVVSQSEVEPVPLEETVATLRAHATQVTVVGLPRVDEGAAIGPDLTPLVLDA